MRASFIVAAHNEGTALWRTVGSCIETAGDLDYEIIVADDASHDGSVAEVTRRFPRVRVVRHEPPPGPLPFGPAALASDRRGVSPTKDLGAREARGDVLVFLDGHCKPEPGALARLIEDVEHLSGAAVVTPTVAALDVPTWENTASQIGHGYFVELEQFHWGWLPLSELRGVDHRGRRFYESPALSGCALAVDRRLYQRLQGFDPHMRTWGMEELDFSLKCWLMGYPILHDPAATVGHRFRSTFDNYSVPFAHLIVNQLRMARKNFTDGTWSDWVERCRAQHGGKLLDHPEGLWAQVWQQFEAGRASLETERSYLLSHRIRDEFWYADRFALSWPRLHSAPYLHSAAALAEDGPQPSGSPSPSPSPSPCKVTGINPATATICINEAVGFTAEGMNLESATWSTSPEGDPATGTGATFSTKWAAPGVKTVTVQCCGTSAVATITVVQVTFNADPVKTGFTIPVTQSNISTTLTATVAPAAAVESVELRVGGEKRVTLGNPVVDEEAGTITVEVKGKTMTPADEPEGDTTIEAVVNESVCGKVQVIVLVPRRIVRPYPQADGVVTPQNIAVNSSTSPAMIDVRDPSVELITIYRHLLNITIEDQFGASLDELYEGARVDERIGRGSWFSINQFLNAQGTYSDPVGLYGRFFPRRRFVHKNSPEAKAWPGEPHRVVPPRTLEQNLHLRVGGHLIVPPPSTPGPAIRNRKIIPTAPDRIKIEWASPQE